MSLGEDDNSDDDESDDNGNDDDSNYDGGDNETDCERTEFDEDEKPNLNQNDDDKEEEYEDYSSVSSNFATQFLKLDNAPPVDNESISTMNVDVHHEEPSNQTPSLLTIPVTVIPETLTAAGTAIPPLIPPLTPLPQLSTLTPHQLLYQLKPQSMPF
ncbi:hypothetical protein Tco_0047021 [Tanacetum coccineum]